MISLLTLILYIKVATASVISLECDEGVCPLAEAVFTCQVTSAVVRWHAPSGTLIGAVSNANNITKANGYTAMFVGNGVSTLTFNATMDRNTTEVQCDDPTDGGPSGTDTCTIIIAG